MQTSSPPLYQDLGLSLDLEPPLQSELPAYTRRPSPPPRTRTQEPIEFTYVLTGRKGQHWASFTLLSNPILSKKIPTFMEGENISGLVKLTLENRESIQAVSMLVTGRIVTGANPGEVYTFLVHPQPVWSKAMGDPRIPVSEGQFSGKLQGEYTWPFSILLPKEVSLGSGSAAQTFHLPQSFLERYTRPSIQYDLTLELSRQKLRPKDRLTATFGYMPVTKPDPPSLLRQLAYQENVPLLGPEIDPEGWQALEPVRIRGTIFGKRPVDGKCTLSLAKPLCYTRGSVVPCALTIECQDLQALDLLSSPKAIDVRLRREIKLLGHSLDAIAWKDTVMHLGSAFWWEPTHGATDIESRKRHLSGEIHLQKDLKPSSAIAHFRVEYSVVLFPFNATAFTSTDTERLLVQTVDIATAYAVGPRPKSYSPIIYNSPVRASNSDSPQTIGS